MTELTHEEKCAVFCIKTLNQMVDKGLVQGKPYNVTEKGLEAIEGFEPTEEDIRLGMEILASNGLFGDLNEQG